MIEIETYSIPGFENYKNSLIKLIKEKEQPKSSDFEIDYEKNEIVSLSIGPNSNPLCWDHPTIKWVRNELYNLLIQNDYMKDNMEHINIVSWILSSHNKNKDIVGAHTIPGESGIVNSDGLNWHNHLFTHVKGIHTEKLLQVEKLANDDDVNSSFYGHSFLSGNLYIDVEDGCNRQKMCGTRYKINNDQLFSMSGEQLRQVVDAPGIDGDVVLFNPQYNHKNITKKDKTKYRYTMSFDLEMDKKLCPHCEYITLKDMGS